jgi:hypothetical protein
MIVLICAANSGVAKSRVAAQLAEYLAAEQVDAGAPDTGERAIARRFSDHRDAAALPVSLTSTDRIADVGWPLRDTGWSYRVTGVSSTSRDFFELPGTASCRPDDESVRAQGRAECAAQVGRRIVPPTTQCGPGCSADAFDGSRFPNSAER